MAMGAEAMAWQEELLQMHRRVSVIIVRANKTWTLGGSTMAKPKQRMMDKSSQWLENIPCELSLLNAGRGIPDPADKKKIYKEIGKDFDTFDALLDLFGAYEAKSPDEEPSGVLFLRDPSYITSQESLGTLRNP